MRSSKFKNLTMALILGLSLGMCFSGVSAFAEGSASSGLEQGKGGDGKEGGGGGEEKETDKLQIKIPQSDQTAMAEVIKKLEKQEELKSKDASSANIGTSARLFGGDSAVLKFDTESFSLASQKSAKQNMEVFTEALKNSQVSAETQQYIFDMIAGTNADASVILIPMLMDSTKADIYSAMKIVDPFLGFMRVVFGIGSIVIVLLLVTSTIVDLCYIGLPMARGEKDGTPKIPFVSVDAESVVKEIASSVGGSDGKYKNPYIMYFKRRALTYIILSICLLYLIAGQLGGLISWFLNLASGLI